MQGSRKIGCKAHIVVRTITLYPDFKLSKSEMASIGPRKLKKLMAAKLKNLEKVFNSEESTTINYKYHVLLPTEEAHHSFHQTRGPAGYAQRIHPKLIEKVYELVSEGITDTQEVKRILKNYTLHTLCTNVQKPDMSDRAYYPTSADVQNHIYRAQKACQLSKLDQENLKIKVDMWQNPESNFHFRPYKSDDSSQDDTTFTQTLLYVHQESWQKQLLKRYGNTISLMDATYKTTKYELALFFIAVKTNVGYSVVGDFVVQSETLEQITEALGILSSWNPEWKPQFFMTDYSEAEIGAIKSVFPMCQTYLCDFHREQSWERWTKERKHGLSADNAELLLCLLRNCAHAPSPTDTSLPSDKYYQEHVKVLKESKIWSQNAHVRDWLQSKWLSIPKV